MRMPAEHWWTVFSALRAVGDWPRARFAAERMRDAAGSTEDAAARRLRYVAQTFLAEAMGRHPDGAGDLVQSEKLYRDALEITRALARELDTPEARRDVSVSLDNVANAARARGDLVGTERLFTESLELSRALARELDTPEARRDVSASLINLAGIAETREDLPAAVEKLKAARAEAEAFGLMQPVSDATNLTTTIDQMLARMRGA